MLLTIGMIVKNEEKFLERCLTAIKPILENVDCELIITDTGSTDKTVEIARKFTDNILHFDWCDDFSAARNFGLEKARGQWFMYLDGDDIFESCDNIINFFNSGEYKNYNSASYIGKNLLDTDGFYANNKQPRMTRIFPETRFKNEIHEVFNTYLAPKKDLNDVAVHYGYLYEDLSKAKVKHERNKKLLLKRLEKEKDTSAFVYVQLCENEDNSLDGDSLKYIEEGIEVSKKLKDISIIPLLIHKARLYQVNFKYSEAIEACNEYFELDKTFRPGVLTADMEILAVKSFSLYKQTEYQEAVEAYKTLFNLYELYRNGQLNTSDADIILIEGMSDRNLVYHISTYLKCLIETEQFQEAYKFISGFSFENIDEKSNITALIDNELNIAEKLDYKNINDYVKSLNDLGKETFATAISRRIYYSDDRDRIIEALRELGKNISYCADLCRMHEDNFSNNISLDQLKQYSESLGLEHHADIIMIAMEKQYDIAELLPSDNEELKKIVWDGYRHYYGFHKAAENYDTDSVTDRASLPVIVKFYEYCMQCTDDFKSPKPNVFVTVNANVLLEKFGEAGRRFSGEAMEDLADNLKGAVIMCDIIDLRRRREYKECISRLKEIISVYEPVAKYVSEYSNAVITEYNDYIESDNKSCEMDKLSVMIKQNIRNYISSGNVAAAQKTLFEYKAIVPDDAEIKDLQKMIEEVTQ